MAGRWALAAACTAAALGSGAPAAADLVVVPHAAGGAPASYFRLTLAPGVTAPAGTLGIGNTSPRPVTIRVDPVPGATIDTLGSTYAAAGTAATGAARWLTLGAREVRVPPGQSVTVPVSVTAPARAAAGDYLAGVSIESVGDRAPRAAAKGVSVASVVRYAIGVEVTLPGTRRPAITFTGAAVRREPAGLTFLLHARNSGNVILQGVHGSALIASGGHTVLTAPLGPGTFVTHSSISYPLLAARRQPREGTVFRVRARLDYTGGTAYLDTLVRFGHAAAERQQAYGGPPAGGPPSGLSAWMAALLGMTAAAVAGLIALVLVRRRRRRPREALPALERALERARESGEGLSVLLVSVLGAPDAPDRVAERLRGRLREEDTVCRIEGRLLVLLAATDIETARVIAEDLRRRAARAGLGEITVSAHAAETGLSAPAQLQRILARDGELTLAR